ncbi:MULTISPECIES: iron ABC transporter permease [unclassified Modicisalibacter]|uniref:FecCD family ABC transporter permease n=1 Tax=unclassified Modicisalibacter TaxID=2679913 RepID=UPI001CC9D4C7|nr:MULTISPECIES: iron ABC transporter permease [unclassified Modicisalibacter]MBZ9558529.1 iron ABC transporter permease [Modicisalibacter sp. R2A 31.J]MBZ9575579.1 iron ABC transporter permease [Modicisalibacter sp. MOD 31.J]
MKYERAIDGRPVLRFTGGLEIGVGNLATMAVLTVAVVVMTTLSLSIGFEDTQVTDLAAAWHGELNDDLYFALMNVRLPRIVLGFMAGWCLALTGALLQSLSRNPLADPGLLGLSQGSMVTILLLLLFIPSAPLGLIPMAAVLGGLAVAALLMWLMRGSSGGNTGLTILLMGIAVDTVLSSVSSILILYAPPEISFAVSAWLAGSLFQASWGSIVALLPWFTLSLPAIIVLGRSMRCHDLGDETAMALGVPVNWSKPLILFVAVLLTSAAVAAVGPLVFLGVMAPHLAGFLSRSAGRARLILSALTGGLLVVAADTLVRFATSDLALPLGLSLTLIGVPLFILTLRLRALANLRSE